jgi:DNA modification methylase
MTDDKPKKVGRLHKTNDSTIVEALRPLAVSIDSLHHDAANARRHGERNLDAIRASLAQFGQRKPIVVQRDGMIVRAGNGTLEAARALGWSEIAAVVIDEDGTTAAQFAIADNRTAELAEWDNETLATLLDGWDAQTNASLGFDQDDVDQLLERLAPHVDVQEDEVPEPPADPITKPGDLWILGKHRLLCGDSTKAEDVGRLMDGEKADAIVTDPPYGMSYQSNRRKDKFDKLENDDKILSKWIAPSRQVSNGWFVFFCAWQRLDEWLRVGREIGDLTNLLIWKKARGMGDLTGSFAPDFEVALAYNRGEKLLCDGRPSAVLEHRIDASVTFKHPTTKPVGLLADILQATTRKSVFDPFLGSGTTLIAAEQLGRRCYGMEIDPVYCDVIVSRWESLTGKKAEIYDGS